MPVLGQMTRVPFFLDEAASVNAVISLKWIEPSQWCLARLQSHRDAPALCSSTRQITHVPGAIKNREKGETSADSAYTWLWTYLIEKYVEGIQSDLLYDI